MIPPEVTTSTVSAAERRVFEMLKETDLPGAVAYHSLQLSDHDYKRAGEIDFLLVAPDGLLVLEVKGGGVACSSEGIWEYTDRYGTVHRSSEGPFRQASSAMFSLERTLAESLGAEVRRLLFAYAVVLPDTALEEPSVEWDQADVWDRTGLRERTGLERLIRRSFTSWGRRSPGRTLCIDDQLRNDLGRKLRPQFDRVPSLRVRAGELDAAMERLTEEQYAALDFLQLADRVIFEGGAGTGKTFLAVEAAKREAVATSSLARLVCSTPEFAGFLRSRIQDTRVEVLAVTELPDEPVKAGVLVVDEAQDLMNFEALGRLDAAVEGGLERGRWRLFLDPNRQKDLVGRFDREAYDFVRDCAVPPIPLGRNCRNTAEIVLQTRLCTGADLGTPISGRGPEVRFVQAAAPDEQIREIDSVVRDLLAEDFSPGELTLLSMTDLSSSVLQQSKTVRSGRARVLDESGFGTWPVHYATMAEVGSFKGMENLAVVLTDLDDIASDPQSIEKLYVGMTRARTQLVLIVNTAAQQFLAELSQENLRTQEGILVLAD